MGRTGDKYPTWVEWLFQSGIGLGNFDPPYALFRQARDKASVLSMARSEADGEGQLRNACVQELGSEDAQRVERALFYLMLVGHPADLSAVEILLDHRSETVRKGARTCRFELRRRGAIE